jgi:hypothetical protein
LDGGTVGRAGVEVRPNVGRWKNIERGCEWVAAKLGVRDGSKLVTCPLPAADLPTLDVSWLPPRLEIPLGRRDIP